jgi:transcription elongation factor GreA
VSVLPSSTRVVFGATVELADQEDGSELRYQIVGEFEADARLGLISITSPIARALVGKNAGDVVEVAVPGGIKAYEIVAVRYS